MKTKKPVTPAVVEANSKDAKTSIGLQSDQGEEASEGNTVRHDLTGRKGRKKKVTPAVVAANAEDRKPSTCSKTGAGKGRATMNGLFTKELRIREEDQPEFEALLDRIKDVA